MAPRNFEESVKKGGPVFEPVFRPHFLIPYKAKGQKTGPYSGLKCWTAFGAKSVLFCVFLLLFCRFLRVLGWSSIVLGASVSCSVSASDNVVVEILLGQSVDHSNASHGQGNRTAKASKKQPAIRSSKRALVALSGFGR